MSQIWVTSDLHFCHDREFIWKPRGFNSVHEMNDAIIKNFNEVVGWDDELYILGDCFLNDNEKGINFMKRLPGTKYIVWGNHDTDTRKQLMQEAGFNCLGFAYQAKMQNHHFYLSHYPTITSNLDENKSLSRRVLNLFGHTHSKNKFYEGRPYMYNVALDAHNNYPVNLTKILEDMQKEVENCFKAI